MGLTNQQKAVIHVAKAQLAMADEDYRALLRRVAGVTSSVELDKRSFDLVMSELERLGFRRPSTLLGASKRRGMATPAQIGRLRSLWKAYSGKDDESHLTNWLEKQFHVSSLRFLDGRAAGKVISVLERRMVPYARAKRAEQPEQGDAIEEPTK